MTTQSNVLNVVVKHGRDGSWFAQGLEIDYAAQGASYEDVRERFMSGLHLTIRENVRRDVSLARALGEKPPNVWPTAATRRATKRLGSARNETLIKHGVKRVDFVQVV